MRIIDPDGKDIRYAIDQPNKTITIEVRVNFKGDISDQRIKYMREFVNEIYSKTLELGNKLIILLREIDICIRQWKQLIRKS
ncbi:hypothetical protein [Sphingobacterium endophyticum]|uniref:hypothetical protein n=1 Tax=Sphingobacterium endophyticum TaxID=2546448 RepID=UPI0012E32D6E|nr:hypothetical protein [Sphingobacterium endophyticum]